MTIIAPQANMLQQLTKIIMQNAFSRWNGQPQIADLE